MKNQETTQHCVDILLGVECESQVANMTSGKDVVDRVLSHFGSSTATSDVQLYRLERLPLNTVLSDSETVVVRINNSNLSCQSIERILENSDENILKSEVAQLRRKLAQSDAIRLEALGTVNQLRNEFMALIEDLAPPHSTPQKTRTIPKLGL